MKKTKLTIFIVMVLLSYYAFHQYSMIRFDAQIKEKYQLEESQQLHIFKLTYDDFINKQLKNTLDKPVIISRADCEHCITFFKRLNHIHSNNPVNVYILESDKMTVSQKSDLENTLYINSVPSLVKVQSGTITDIYSGYITDEILESLS